MFTDLQAAPASIDLQAEPRDHQLRQAAQAIPRERGWRRIDRGPEAAIEDITISRWEDFRDSSSHDATTPEDRYFVGIALKATRAKLTRDRQVIFDGTMPAGTLYVSAPSKPLAAQFQAPCAFLHFHISADHFPAQSPAAEGLGDLVLLRDPLAAELARALTEHGDAADREFTRCVGQTLAMHLARLEPPRARVNALPKWRLRRVEQYIADNFDRCISLSELANVAGLSRMHFAAQFRAATGYRPREYLLNHRIENAKTLLATTGRPLAEIALAVGFSTQAHFSTVFKRISGQSPARWRLASKAEPLAAEALPRRRPAADRDWMASAAA
ncbi:AraC family transcriptional regulator [Bradyrhizobium diazoefficiens]|nr:AraC family transcriptional regulator [Bradyrhizobium diazoefficiens]APO51437.1 transcriptional regulator [Bradyrhizobium diazoefficiens]KOY06300.1 transcriptional regulator [Bradyrhizobium diazoefficiens]MCD9293218.1 AraC family transcriptional regulator [Bradyrhizobium diazoefficiens]MCD9815347.1 AraC family transcriptional regulator [Bradyrhizobium diazoefficiens]MCD9829721.1 AraC family transcriptional regulator [Bradyrhizobium diazoefficiens]